MPPPQFLACPACVAAWVLRQRLTRHLQATHRWGKVRLEAYWTRLAKAEAGR